MEVSLSSAEAAPLHQLEDCGCLPRPGRTRDDDAPVGGEAGAKVVRDLGKQPLTADERGIRITVGDFEEQGLQGPAGVAEVRVAVYINAKKCLSYFFRKSERITEDFEE